MRLLMPMLFASAIYGADVKLAGQITEDATYQPIPGATVQVFGPEGDNAAEHKVSTDSDGRFTIDLPAGRYNVVAHATGYDATRRANIGLNEGERLRQLNLSLTGFASIEGRILDRSSKTPLELAAVRAVKVSYLRGQRQKWNVRNVALTGPSGDFRLDKLPAGEYLIEIQPELQPQKREDGRTTGYGREIWPGALPAASPLLLPGNGNLALGNILVERTVLGVVTITVDGACVKDTIYNVAVYETDQATRSQRGSIQANCNQPKKLTLSPGEYQIVATPPMRGSGTGEAISGTALGVAAFLHNQSDQQVGVTLKAPILVSGVLSVEGHDLAPQWARPLPVHLVPIGESRDRRVSAVDPLYNLPTWQDKEGKFTLRLQAAHEAIVELQLPMLPPNYYVKELLYNGAPAERFFHFNSYSPVQHLQVVLSSGPASFHGTVRDDHNKAVADAKVLLARWPAILGASYPLDLVEAPVDNNGGFTIAGLRPGTYRAVVATPERRMLLEEPGRLANALSVAADIQFAPNERLARDLKISEP